VEASNPKKVKLSSEAPQQQFLWTAFNEYLVQDHAEYLVIVGSSSANCVPTTARDGFDRGYKWIVVADTGTAFPLNPHGRNRNTTGKRRKGYGQYWESLRNIQAQYADVMSSDEFRGAGGALLRQPVNSE
jgi:isochorismate hydrolase